MLTDSAVTVRNFHSIYVQRVFRCFCCCFCWFGHKWPSKRFQSTQSIQLEDGMLLSLLLLSVSPLCVGSAYACLGCIAIANEETDRLERKQQNIQWHSFFSHVITRSTLFGLLGLYFPSDLAQWLRLCLFACGVMMMAIAFRVAKSVKCWMHRCAPPPFVSDRCEHKCGFSGRYSWSPMDWYFFIVIRFFASFLL